MKKILILAVMMLTLCGCSNVRKSSIDTITKK